MFTREVNQDISLKLLQEGDAAELFNLVQDSRERLRKWLPWVDFMKTEADYGPIIDTWLKQFADHNGFQAGIIY